METPCAHLELELIGAVFDAINAQFHHEQQRMQAGEKMRSTKMGDWYNAIFSCNPQIHLRKAESFGDAIIDDNHVVFEWEILDCVVTFWYEQYWDMMDMTISLQHAEDAIREIVKAFECYFHTRFSHQLTQQSVIAASEPTDGTIQYRLTIAEEAAEETGAPHIFDTLEE